VQQVCENGHQITYCHDIRPEEGKKFCPECGAPTLIACPSCEEPIQGSLLKFVESWTGTGGEMMPEYPADIPRFCQNCGEAYPWTQKKIQTAIQILMEFGDLNEEEKKTINQDIENVAKDVPEAELSARRIKRIWDKGSRAGYEVIMELASRTAAKILKG